jgi:hypothetical protein
VKSPYQPPHGHRFQDVTTGRVQVDGVNVQYSTAGRWIFGPAIGVGVQDSLKPLEITSDNVALDEDGLALVPL